MNRIKIIGAGSIGAHHAHACRRLGWLPIIVDKDGRALTRMKEELYPSRYGAWDDAIELHHSDAAPSGGFDLVIVGTPPDSHVALAIAALAERPRALLIEKPLAPPRDPNLGRLTDAVRQTTTRVFVGYDHVVGEAAEMVDALIREGAVGAPITIDVEFREHWAGIFAAHPWLDGPSDTYLGYSSRGGGASGEHSHALNLWEHFARVAGAGAVADIRATLDYVRDGRVEYDRLCLVNLRTETGLVGRVVQDVVTQPPRKWARIQGERGAIEWQVGYAPGADAVIVKRPGNDDDVRVITKSRPDDFIRELRHIEHACSTGSSSPIDYECGLQTMRVIEAVHAAHSSGSAVQLMTPAATETAR